jgi:CBS domain-containing protein
MKVRDILKIKGGALFTVSPSTPLREAIAAMAAHDVGSLVVMDSGRYAGMLTFRELLGALAILAPGADSTVGQHCRRDAPACSMSDELESLRELMVGTHARYVPVLEAGDLMGVVSFFDVARAVLEEHRFETRMLKAYIQNWPEEDPIARRADEAPISARKAEADAAES